jgi:hypothetical protein
VIVISDGRSDDRWTQRVTACYESRKHHSLGKSLVVTTDQSDIDGSLNVLN